MLKKSGKMARRGFLARAAILASAPYIVPASVLGRNGTVPPSERILMGGIGIGGRGRST
jgi:hypothetical protein